MAFIVTIFMGFVGYWIDLAFNFEFFGYSLAIATMGYFILYFIEKQNNKINKS